jgi:transcriptional regulator with PAS, ATPase and Fis domain
VPENALRKGELLEDMYYRLNVIQIPLPPLRQRGDDPPLLTEMLIEMLNRKHETRVLNANSEAGEQLSRYSWPGNVRELLNVLEPGGDPGG